MAFASVDLVPLSGGSITVRDARSDATADVRLGPFGIGRTTLAFENGLPVHPVTWFEAIDLCNALSAAENLTPAYAVAGRQVSWDVSADGYRLPTEAEWEWACRAASATPTYGPLADIAWTAADAVTAPQPVAGKAPNDFGLFDTLGNLWEWCWNYADPARYGDYRSLRGGGWADREWSVRASVRRGSAPDARLEDVGVRVARGAVGAQGAREAQGWSAAADEERANISGPLPLGWTPLGRASARLRG